MTNVTIDKPGENIFKVHFAASNRQAGEKELQVFIAGRPFKRYVDHFNPNSQIIEIDLSVKPKEVVTVPTNG